MLPTLFLQSDGERALMAEVILILARKPRNNHKRSVRREWGSRPALNKKKDLKSISYHYFIAIQT